MSRTEGIYVTARIMDYIQNYVDPLVRDKWFLFLEKTYLEMSHDYNEAIEKYGAINAFKMAIHDIDETFVEEKIIESGVTCKMGCNHCCHIEVASQEIEVKVILEYCKQNNITIDKNYLSEQSQWGGKNIFDHPTNAACVFLKDNKCSIYDVRPVACRNHYVYSDPALCNAKKFRPPSAGIAMSFHFPTEIFICVIEDKDASKRGWLVDLLLKQL